MRQFLSAARYLPRWSIVIVAGAKMILKSEGKRFRYSILLASLYLIAQGIGFNPLRIFYPLLGIVPTTHNIFND
jgi:hypothetical protein